MEYRQLGKSGLRVSRLALGAMTFGMPKWGCDEGTAVSLIDRYIDAGGMFIDTADGYGMSEEICGRALAGRRSKVVLSTKFGLPMALQGVNGCGASRKHIRDSCEASLKRLQTDHIDLYHLHMEDLDTPLEETLAALDDLVRAGKVLYLGVSNFRAYRVMKALAISERRGHARFVSLQAQYNLVVRTMEREHFALLREEGLGFVSWSPLAAGLLTGKFKDGAPPPDTRLHQRSFEADQLFLNEQGLRVAQVVAQVAAELGCSPAQLALAWQLTRPEVDAVIIGARTLRQLDDNLACQHLSLTQDIIARIEAPGALAPEYPGAFIETFRRWMQMVRRGGPDSRRSGSGPAGS
jgi:aryl-alcohol dehydrogenase-like predicted oxidoreductase